MLSTTAAYLSIENNLPRQLAATAASPDVKTATAYYMANIGKVTSISDFVNNYQLFSYAMKAYGLSDLTYAKGLMTKVLEGGVTDNTALANTLSDPRYKAFATAFNFAANGASATTTAAATTGTTSAYIEQTLEDTEGNTNQGVQLALYFQRTASSVTSSFGLLADSAMLKVVQTIYGISPYSSEADIDSQAAYLDKVLNIKDLQDPAKVQALAERFTASWDAAGDNTTASSFPANALLASGTSTGTGLSADLLMSIAGLQLGGSEL